MGMTPVVPSFTPQRNRRIDASGAKRGNDRRADHHDGEYDEHETGRCQIVRRYAEQQTFNRSSEHNRQHQADDGAANRDTQRTPCHERDDVAGGGTKSATNAEVAQPLLCRVGGHAEQADSREQCRHAGERRGEHGAKSVAARGRVGNVAERLRFTHAGDLRSVDTRDRGAHRSCQSRSVP